MKSIRLGLCVTMGVATGIALACYPGSVVASERAFEMKAYVDYPGGRDLIAGNYAKAMQAAKRDTDRTGDAGMIANTNLCVAFTKSRRFAEAEAACNRAVTLAERSGVSAPRLQYGNVNRRYVAIALSNRGVFRAVSGDPRAATQDFREAASIARAGADLPRRNLAYLQGTTAERVAMNKDARAQE